MDLRDQGSKGGSDPDIALRTVCKIMVNISGVPPMCQMLFLTPDVSSDESPAGTSEPELHLTKEELRPAEGQSKSHVPGKSRYLDAWTWAVWLQSPHFVWFGGEVDVIMTAINATGDLCLCYFLSPGLLVTPPELGSGLPSWDGR